jgi:hypothetical protein
LFHVSPLKTCMHPSLPSLCHISIPSHPILNMTSIIRFEKDYKTWSPWYNTPQPPDTSYPKAQILWSILSYLIPSAHVTSLPSKYHLQNWLRITPVHVIL